MIKAEIERTSLSDHVYARIVDAVHSGTLPAGAPLHVADLAAQYGVSPSPVRDAISRLAAEGLAVNNANRRTTVVSFSRQDIAETFVGQACRDLDKSRLCVKDHEAWSR